MLTGWERQFAGQGPLFWGAAAAAALGASLLAAAAVLQLRRRRPRLRLSFRPRRRAGAVPAGVARAVPGGYAPAVPAVRAANTPVPGAMPPDLGPLLARLRRASDRLAALQPVTGESNLKAAPGGVDHLYRRGLG